MNRLMLSYPACLWCLAGVLIAATWPASRAQAITVRNLTTGQTLLAESYEVAAAPRTDGTAYDAATSAPPVGVVTHNVLAGDHANLYRDGSATNYPAPATGTGDWYLEMRRGAGAGNSPWHQPRYTFDPAATNAAGDTLRIELMIYLSVNELVDDATTIANIDLYRDASVFGGTSWLHNISFTSTGTVRHFSNGVVVILADQTHTPNAWNHVVIEYVNGNAGNTAQLSVNGAPFTSIGNANAVASDALRAVSFRSGTTSTLFFVDSVVPEPASTGLALLGAAMLIHRSRRMRLDRA